MILFARLGWIKRLNISTATIRKSMDPVARQNLTDFGQYVAECMPKYVQKVQLTAGDELEVLIAPEGVLPVISFLKEHHNAQFASLADIAGLDMPTREYRFEVSVHGFINDLAPKLGYFLQWTFYYIFIC